MFLSLTLSLAFGLVRTTVEADGSSQDAESALAVTRGRSAGGPPAHGVRGPLWQTWAADGHWAKLGFAPSWATGEGWHALPCPNAGGLTGKKCPSQVGISYKGWGGLPSGMVKGADLDVTYSIKFKCNEPDRMIGQETEFYWSSTTWNAGVMGSSTEQVIKSLTGNGVDVLHEKAGQTKNRGRRVISSSVFECSDLSLDIQQLLKVDGNSGLYRMGTGKATAANLDFFAENVDCGGRNCAEDFDPAVLAFDFTQDCSALGGRGVHPVAANCHAGKKGLLLLTLKPDHMKPPMHLDVTRTVMYLKQ